MTHFERSLTVGIGAEAAYARLADPRRLTAYAPTVEHIGTQVVDGDPDAEAEEGAEGPAADAVEGHFLADAATRRVEWSIPGTGYAGSVVVGEGTASTSQVTVRLEADGEPDPAEVERLLDDSVRTIRRLLSGR